MKYRTSHTFDLRDFDPDEDQILVTPHGDQGVSIHGGNSDTEFCLDFTWAQALKLSAEVNHLNYRER